MQHPERVDRGNPTILEKLYFGVLFPSTISVSQAHHSSGIDL